MCVCANDTARTKAEVTARLNMDKLHNSDSIEFVCCDENVVEFVPCSDTSLITVRVVSKMTDRSLDEQRYSNAVDIEHCRGSHN